MNVLTVVPYQCQRASKKAQVADMFNHISKRYDFLNHFLSLGIDVLWRRRALSALKNDRPELILDVATGTADFAIEALKLQPKKIIGVDISEGMLDIGREKIKKLGCEDRIELRLGDSEQLLFDEDTFDAVVVAFGVRNFEDLEKGLSDMYKVLKRGGKLVVLEFSQPTKFPVKTLYHFYSKAILPWIGQWISRDRSAYSYLPASVAQFPYGQDFMNILARLGFKTITCNPLTFGISSVYTAIK